MNQEHLREKFTRLKDAQENDLTLYGAVQIGLRFHEEIGRYRMLVNMLIETYEMMPQSPEQQRLIRELRNFLNS